MGGRRGRATAVVLLVAVLAAGLAPRAAAQEAGTPEETGAVTVRVTDAVTGGPVPGVGFRLYFEDCATEPPGWEGQPAYLTGGDGTALFAPLVAETAYCVQAQAIPPGYLEPDPALWAAVATAKGAVLDVVLTPATPEPPAPATGDLYVTKVDPAGALLAGACFVLTPVADPAAAVSACDADDGDDGGTTIFAGLAPGDYGLTETQAPAGYAPGGDAAVAVTAGENATTVVNQPLPPPTGAVHVVRVACAGATGVVIEVGAATAPEAGPPPVPAGCVYAAGEFAIYPYGNLGAEPALLRTGTDGGVTLTGILPADGATGLHLLVDLETSAQAPFPVAPDLLTPLVVSGPPPAPAPPAEAVAAPATGTLAVSAVRCPGAEGDTTVAPGGPDAAETGGCLPDERELAVHPFGEAGAALPVRTGPDGTAALGGLPVTDEASGPHTVVDLASGAATEFHIGEAGTAEVRVVAPVPAPGTAPEVAALPDPPVPAAGPAPGGDADPAAELAGVRELPRTGTGGRPTAHVPPLPWPVLALALALALLIVGMAAGGAARRRA